MKGADIFNTGEGLSLS